MKLAEIFLDQDRDLDVVTVGTVMAEISPPEHSMKVTDAESLVLVQAGSATTFALAFSRLGGRLGLISRVGEDEVGRWIVETLASEGVNTTEIRVVPGQLTPISLASVDAEGRKSFAYYRFAGFSEPIGTLRSEDIDDDYLKRAKVFEITESSLRSIDSRPVALELARRASRLGCLVSVNPNFRPTAWKGGTDEARRVLREALSLADIAIMNGEEAELVAETSDVKSALDWMVHRGPEICVITQGQSPSIVMHSGDVWRVPAVQARVVFDIGAGDTFHAGFLAQLTSGANLTDAVRFANQAAALKIQRPPKVAQLPTKAEVDTALGIG